MTLAQRALRDVKAKVWHQVFCAAISAGRHSVESAAIADNAVQEYVSRFYQEEPR